MPILGYLWQDLNVQVKEEAILISKWVLQREEVGEVLMTVLEEGDLLVETLIAVVEVAGAIFS